MQKSKFHFSALLTLAGVALAGSALADSVSGEFVLNGKTFQPTEVAAFRVRDSSNPREFRTFVMLTSQPLQRERIAQDTDPYAVAINDDAVRGADYLSIWVRGDGETSLNANVGGTQYIDTSGVMMGQKGSLITECSENSPKRVSCAVKVAQPVKVAGADETWSVDLAFDTEVLARPAGKLIAADGGEPGNALLALIDAAKGDDFNRILAGLSQSKARDFQPDYNTPEENLADAKQWLGNVLPKKPVITGGEYVNDDFAILEVEGSLFEGSDGKWLYLLNMRREDGRWGFEGGSPAGKLE